MPRVRAIIYARVSNDTSGQARSVTQQVAECTEVCDRNGWNIFQVITDNSVGASRHSAGTRPGYARLRTILREGDVLVMWESSRGTRDLAEFVQFRDLCAERNVLYNYKNRTYDMRSGEDRFTTGFDALRDESEAERTRDRVLRASRARAASGAPHGRMPYGYRRHLVEGDRTGRIEWIPDPETAPIVREIVDRVLVGQTLWTIGKDLDARGIPAPSRGGNQPPAAHWIPRRIRVMVLSPTYAGLRVHKGEVVGEGTWEPLVTRDEHRRLTAILTDPARKTNHRRGKDPVHLLTGTAKCGVCGKGVRYFGPEASTRTPRYSCPDNHVGRRVDRVDEMVRDKMIQLMSDPRLQAALVADDGQESGAALAELAAERQRLQGFYAEAADGKLSSAGLAAVESRILAHIEELERAARRLPVTNPVLAQILAEVSDPATQWDTLPLVVRREAIRAALDIRIYPQPAMGRRWDPQYVSVQWRE